MAAKPRPKTTTRKVGRPKKGERVSTPEFLRKINKMYLEGRTQGQIAATLGCSAALVGTTVSKRLRPLWEANIRADKALVLAKVAHMEAVAWAHFRAKGPAETSEEVKREMLEAAGDGQERELIKKACKTIQRLHQVDWLKVVQWCLDFRAKIQGLYAAEKHEHSFSGFRAAGTDPDESTRQMLTKCLEAIERKRKQKKAEGLLDQSSI